MKTRLTAIKVALAVGITNLAAMSVLAGPPVVTVQVPAPAPVYIPPPPPPAIVVAPNPVPPPVATVEISTVPDSYVWDGTEYVGVIGTQYYYLNPDKFWIQLDTVREQRFREYERLHSDWRSHLIRNEQYRRDARGHEYPLHDNHDAGHHDNNRDNHDGDHHDRSHDHR